MLIVIEYKDGRIKEFDPSAFTSMKALSDAPRRQPQNVMTEFDLRLDLLEKEGLRLDIFWYDTSLDIGTVDLDGLVDENGRPVQAKRAARKVATSILLINKLALKRVSRIIVQRAGSQVTAAWRQGEGDWLILGAKFDAQRVQTYTDPSTSSANAQAVNVFKYLKRANQNMTDEEISTLMGYPLDAIRYIQESESAQLEAIQGTVKEGEAPIDGPSFEQPSSPTSLRTDTQSQDEPFTEDDEMSALLKLFGDDSFDD